MRWTDMEVKPGLNVSTDDFYYDLFEGGYIRPEDILVSQTDVNMVRTAIDIVKKFKDACEQNIEDFIR